MHFPLHPDTPQEGMALEDLFPGRDLTPMKERMKRLMAEAGLPYGERSHTYNSRLAQELGAWADTQPGGEALHDALYRAYFADCVNIGDVDTLVEVATSVGLDGPTARGVLETRRFREQVDQDWQRARQSGITGVPTFNHGQYVVVGCQPYEVLERFVKAMLQEAGA